MKKLVALALLAACDDAQDTGTPQETTQPVSACTWNFRADVREGPTAPLTLEGKATLREAEPGQILVQLDTADATLLAGGTVMQAADGQDLIHLHFVLPDGGTIDGVGPLPSPIADCTGELVGDLVGPQEGDRGDWLASSAAAETLCVVATAPCSLIPRTRSECRNNYCSFDFNRQPGESISECTDRCDSGSDLEYAYYVCGTGGGGVSTFFGSGSGGSCP